MYKYVNILDETSGLCAVGTGANIEKYKALGMVRKDVEQSEVDGCWYLTAKCPHYTDEEKAQKEIETLSKELRAKRDAELDATDFYLMSDYPISGSDLTLIQKYRQELRDLPQQKDFPYVDFPVNPLTPKVEE